MFKSISLSFLLAFIFTIGSADAQGDSFEMRFWDGTFAYNQLIVTPVASQPNIVRMRLRGSQINLGSQIEGLPQIWSARDLMDFTFVKAECDEFDVKNMVVRCSKDKVYVGNLTWQTSQRFSRTFSGVVEDVEVVANKKMVTVKFKAPSDDDFTPHQDTVIVTFPLTFF